MGTSKLEFLGAATIILKVLFVSCMNIYKYCFCVIFLLFYWGMYFCYSINSGVYEA